MKAENCINFTMKTLKALQPSAKREFYYDNSIPNLAFAVNPKGSKTWFLYQWINRRPERIKIGRFPVVTLAQSKGQLKKLQGEIAHGFNPAQEKRDFRNEPTLQVFFNVYMERYAKIQKRSWKQDVSLFKNYLSPLANKKLSQITDAQVSRLHRKIGKENGKISANRAVTLLKTVFNKAIKWNEFSGATNPAVKVDMYPESSREVFLTKNDVKSFVAQVMKEDDEGFRVFVNLCIMTGLRSGNLFSLKWSQVICFERLEIPRSNMKNKKAHIAPLTENASLLLKNWKLKCGGKSEYVFHDGDSTKCGRRFRYLFSKASKKSGVECSPHSLRHFVGSALVSSGVSLAITQQVLGHLSYKSTLVYSRVAPNTVRQSLRLVTDDFFEESEKSEQILQNVV